MNRKKITLLVLFSMVFSSILPATIAEQSINSSGNHPSFLIEQTICYGTFLESDDLSKFIFQQEVYIPEGAYHYHVTNVKLYCFAWVINPNDIDPDAIVHVGFSQTSENSNIASWSKTSVPFDELSNSQGWVTFDFEYNIPSGYNYLYLGVQGGTKTFLENSLDFGIEDNNPYSEGNNNKCYDGGQWEDVTSNADFTFKIEGILNIPPCADIIGSPGDGSTVTTNSIFIRTFCSDDDLDNMEYDLLEYYPNGQFKQVLYCDLYVYDQDIVEYHWTGLQHGQTYKWKIQLQDTPCNEKYNSEIMSFTVDLENEEDEYTLSVISEPNEAGYVNINPQMSSYPSGTSVALTPCVNDPNNWKFDHWSADASGNQNPLTITMNSDKTIKAHYSRKTSGNNLPYTPSDPFPTDNDYDIGVTATLTWEGGDPDENDEVFYNVYIGTENPPQLVYTGCPHNYYDYPNNEPLEYNTGYYWKIVAQDNHYAETEGPVWYFTTQKNQINNDEYWALIAVPFPDDEVYNSVENHVNKLKNTLINGGWNPDHIKTINKCTYNQFKEEFCNDGWLKTHVTPGDKVMIWVYSHGAVFPFLGGYIYLRGIGGYNPVLSPWLFHWMLNAYLNSLRSQKITMVINTCHSGGALDALKRDERVILTACKENEEGNGYTFAEALRTGFAGWADLEPYGGNSDGLISSEEAFKFAKPLATDSDTTPLKGDYYPKINFNKNEKSILSTPWEGKLDQYQKQAEIFYTMPVETWYAQSFKPGYSTIKEISLQISQLHHNEKLIVSLRKDKASSPGPLDYDIPNSENYIHLETCTADEWQDINIVLNNGDGIEVTPGDTYYIVIRSYIDQEIYSWGGIVDRGSYSKGEAWRSTDDGATWHKHPEVGDFSFFVFGKNDKNHDAKNLNINGMISLKNSFQYLIKNLMHQFPLLSRLLNSAFV